MSIRIQSKMNINVTPGLQCEDLTNKESDIPNRLKVSPTWPNETVLIREGVGEYPDYLAQWDSVKELVNCGILTIAGNVVDVQPKVVEAKTEAAEDKVKKLKEKARKLEDIAAEE